MTAPRLEKCSCRACQRAALFESLMADRDFDRMAFSYRALLNYILVLEDRLNPQREKIELLLIDR
jgi:hypothetical protein